MIGQVWGSSVDMKAWAEFNHLSQSQDKYNAWHHPIRRLIHVTSATRVPSVVSMGHSVITSPPGSKWNSRVPTRNS